MLLVVSYVGGGGYHCWEGSIVAEIYCHCGLLLLMGVLVAGGLMLQGSLLGGT